MMGWFRRLVERKDDARDQYDVEVTRLLEEARRTNEEVIRRLNELDDPMALVHGARNLAHSRQKPNGEHG
jgi:hypothetical protein